MVTSRNGTLIAAVAALLGSLTILSCGGSIAQAQDYEKVLAAANRTEDDRSNDKRREALKLLEFTGPKTGMLVLDMGAGAGYSTELMARAVGPTGKVWGQNGPLRSNIVLYQFEKRFKGSPIDNVAEVISPMTNPAPGLPPVDLVTFFFAYHDTTFMGVDRPKMNKAILAALKPGGVLVVVDHSARPEDGATVGETYHRVSETIVRAELEAAGFEFVNSSDFLRNPEDPRTSSSLGASIKVDQFVLKFRKPA